MSKNLLTKEERAKRLELLKQALVEKFDTELDDKELAMLNDMDDEALYNMNKINIGELLERYAKRFGSKFPPKPNN